MISELIRIRRQGGCGLPEQRSRLSCSLNINLLSSTKNGTNSMPSWCLSASRMDANSNRSTWRSQVAASLAIVNQEEVDAFVTQLIARPETEDSKMKCE